jgi:hypothetical protein
MHSSSDPTLDFSRVLKELTEFQNTFFDKASTYTKVIIGLGYGAFFTAWSGTKSHLSPRLLLWSALLVTTSLVFFLAFEICQTLIISYLGIRFTQAVSESKQDVLRELETFSSLSRSLTRPLLKAWIIVFPVSALSGLAGAAVLIAAFVHSILRLS